MEVEIILLAPKAGNDYRLDPESLLVGGLKGLLLATPWLSNPEE